MQPVYAAAAVVVAKEAAGPAFVLYFAVVAGNQGVLGPGQSQPCAFSAPVGRLGPNFDGVDVAVTAEEPAGTVVVVVVVVAVFEANFSL